MDFIFLTTRKGTEGKEGPSMRVDELWAAVTQIAHLTCTDTCRPLWPKSALLFVHYFRKCLSDLKA
jgi:hypothetical protein